MQNSQEKYVRGGLLCKFNHVILPTVTQDCLMFRINLSRLPLKELLNATCFNVVYLVFCSTLHFFSVKTCWKGFRRVISMENGFEVFCDCLLHLKFPALGLALAGTGSAVCGAIICINLFNHNISGTAVPNNI